MSMESFRMDDQFDAVMHRQSQKQDEFGLGGIWTFRYYDLHRERLLWEEMVNNIVMTVGRTQVLDAALGPGAYTLVGPFMGLISSVSYTTGPALGDTMGAHGGWTEAGTSNAPTYSGTRRTAVFAAGAAGVKALTAALTFTFTGGGILKGAFIVFGPTATSAIMNTGGVLYSAGVFSGGDKTVANLETLDVSYSSNANL